MIVGGVQEELSLHKLTEDITKEVVEAANRGHVNEEQLAEKLHAKYKAEG